MTQLHKNFTDEAVKDLLEKYLSNGIKIATVLNILGIKRSRFFKLLQEYRNNPSNFSIQYTRKKKTREIRFTYMVISLTCARLLQKFVFMSVKSFYKPC